MAYTRFVYHGDQVAFETDSSGTLGLRYTWGPGTDNLLAVRNASGTIHAYAVPDRLGSVRGLVKRDGTVLYAFTYRPYGELADSAGSGGLELRYRWTGREYDAETGWYFHRSRYYDPAARRFVQEDRIGYAGGRNVYAYVDGRVMEATDPSGLHAEASTLRKHRPDVPLVSLGEWVNAEMDALFGGSFGGLSAKAVYSQDGQWLGNVGCTPLLGCDQKQAQNLADAWAARQKSTTTPSERASSTPTINVSFFGRHPLPPMIEPELATSKHTAKMIARFTSSLEGTATLITTLPPWFPGGPEGKLWYFEGVVTLGARGVPPVPFPMYKPVHGYLYNWPAGTGFYTGEVYDRGGPGPEFRRGS